MGGRDRSELQIQKKRAETLRLQRQLVTLRSQAADFQGALAEALRTSTAGIRSTFSAETAQATEWIKRAAQKVSNADTGELRKTHAAMTELVEDGETLLRQLLICFSKRGDEMAEGLAKRLVSVRSLLIKHNAECSKWFTIEAAGWKQDIEQASRFYDDELYKQAEDVLEAVEESIAQCCADSEELAKQQQARSYLLKAVRQVCCNMGMQENGPPRLEHPNDAASRILFTVASPDKGKLRFALSLDGIQSLGEATDCKKDLRQFSELLSSGFDIRTKFHSLSEEEPDLRNAGARLLPDTAECSTQTQG